MEPVPVSATAGTRRGSLFAAARDHRRAFEGTIDDHGAAGLRGHRRQGNGDASVAPRRVEGSGAGALRVRSRLLDRAALRRAVADGIREELVRSHGVRESDPGKLALRLSRVQPDAARASEHWGHRLLSFLATAPVAIPGIVLAVGLFLSYTHPPLVLYGTLAIIFLAYVTKELPVGYQQIGAALKAVHPELEDASRIFGATRLRALVDITGPLIRSGLVTTWILIFIGSIRELSATILLFTARTKTVSVTMFDLRESNDWGPIAVLSITMLAITFALVSLIDRFTHRRTA
ncbi:MAG: iron ABC transporter permease [Betaproteobacteria bacterium]|nr:MAG: iron ABC transporter permease [Betaproteobacteria bacterium]